MAVLFGDKQKDGWLRVSQIQYQMDAHPNGHTIKIEKMPPYPPRQPGVAWVQMYNPKTKKWRYDKEAVPLTQEESLQEIAAAVRELAEAVRTIGKGLHGK